MTLVHGKNISAQDIEHEVSRWDAVLFARLGKARGFGSKAIVRDALIGAAFALVAYIGFAKTLGINIGSGLVTRPLSAIILALAALALFGPKLYALAMRPKPDHVPGDA
jgi:hypothetical protein